MLFLICFFRHFIIPISVDYQYVTNNQQDFKKKDALCIAVFFIGSARWYILEGQREYDDFVLFGIIVGLAETEYGYISANEMASVALDASKYGLGTIMVEQEKAFQPCKLSAIQDGELQSFLNRLYD